MAKRIEVARLGQETTRLALPDDANIEDVLRAAGIELSEGEEVRIDGDDMDVDSDYVPEDGDLVVVAPKSKQG